MSVALDDLIRYWHGRLPPEREAEVEEALFDDEVTAQRLEAVARLDAAIYDLVHSGSAQAALTVEAVGSLSNSGLQVRTYRIEPGQTVPCTVGLEDFVVIRLQGDFPAQERVDVFMDGTFEGMPPQSERYDDVPIDREANELVLVYPGDRIRSLPRSQFTYTVISGGRTIGEFGLDHTPMS